MTKLLVQITLRAVVSEEDARLDRLLDADSEAPGCPLNLLPRLVVAAEDENERTSACQFCGGRAEAFVVREATAEDEEVYTWASPSPRGGEGAP